MITILVVVVDSPPEPEQLLDNKHNAKERSPRQQGGRLFESREYLPTCLNTVV